MSRAGQLFAAALALLASLALASLAHAEPVEGPFVIRLSAAPQAILAEIEPLTAYVGNVECGRQASTPTGPVVDVGGPGRPGLCHTRDAPVTLLDRHGEQLFEQPVFRAGEEHELVNLARGPREAPSPVGVPGNPSPAVAGHGGSAGDGATDFASWLALGAITLGVLTFGRHLTQPVEE